MGLKQGHNRPSIRRPAAHAGTGILLPAYRVRSGPFLLRRILAGCKAGGA